MAIAHHAATEQDRFDAETIWDFHQVDHDLVPCDDAIGLGSHDLGVATYAAKLYHDNPVPAARLHGRGQRHHPRPIPPR